MYGADKYRGKILLPNGGKRRSNKLNACVKERNYIEGKKLVLERVCGSRGHTQSPLISHEFVTYNTRCTQSECLVSWKIHQHTHIRFSFDASYYSCPLIASLFRN